MFLNIKTEYNFLQSLCKIDSIIKYAKENKNHQLAIVDDNYFIDSSKFINECHKNDIKPIVGVKKDIENSFLRSVIIYAKNSSGIKEINQIDIKINNLDILISDNLIISFDLKNLKEENIKFIKEKFDNFYFNYDEKIITNLESYNFGKEIEDLISSKMIFNEEARFVYKKELDAFLVLSAINNKKTYKEEKKRASIYENFCMENISLKKEHIYDNILENSKKLIDEIKDYKTEYSYKQTLDFQEFKDIDFEELLVENLKNYLEEKDLMHKKKEYYYRLKYELKVIEDMDFVNYFLIMQQIVDFCNENDIYYGYGRGSAAGSLVSFLLNITKIDPIIYNLYFERFLNPQRASMPDIDLDISDLDRQKVVDFLISKYGKKHVAKIFTINTYLVKSALNDVGKVLEIDKNILKKISSKLDSSYTLEENIEKEYNFFSKYIINSQFDFLRDILAIIEGLPKTTSIHAAGVIISAVDINNHAYVSEDLVYSEAKYLEKAGFIKFDLLALSTLSFLQKLERDVKVVNPQYDKKNIPLNDKLVYKNLEQAKTFGIFQLESAGIKKLMKRYKPTSLMDIAILISLYRPGPMKNIDKYIENKSKFPNIKYAHEDLKPILEQTYGIMVFQEQIMEVVSKIASFSKAESDIFRVSMSKKNLEAMQVQEEKFISQGLENGYSEPFLEYLFEDIKEFAGYGFNKAHALSYGRLIYQLMYVKSRYPTIFYSDMYLTNIGSTKKDEFLLELYSNDIIIAPPTLKNLIMENEVSRGKIQLGLVSIKNISKEKLLLIKDRCEKYIEKENIVDFLTEAIIKVNLNDVEIKSLVGSGFLDALSLNRKTLVDTLLNYSKEELMILSVNGEKIKIKESEDYSFLENAKLESDALGFNIKYSPEDYLISKFKKRYPNVNLTPLTFQYKDLEVSKKYFVIGAITSIKEITTKNGKKMAFLSIKDKNKEVELTCFPDEYEKYKKDLHLIGTLNIFCVKRNKRDSLSLDELIK